MQYEDTLENCLTMLSKKYPDKKVEVNHNALHSQSQHIGGGTFSEILSQLRTVVPQMLQNTAHVLESDHTGEIFVLDYSETEHLFLYHY